MSGSDDEDEDAQREAEGGDTFDVTLGNSSFRVRQGETLGAVKRRMSVETGLSPEQMAVLLGAADGDDDKAAASTLSAGAVIKLPQRAGAVKVQFKGKGSFEPVMLSLTNGDLVFRQAGQSKERTGSAVGCTLNFPKKARKGHEHAFRIDLASKDSIKCVKYVFSVVDADDLKLWSEAFGAYSGMTQAEVAATLDGERLSDSDEDAEDAEDEDQTEEGGGDTFGDVKDGESFGVMVDGKEFHVSKMESMGAVKRRMSMSTGLTPEQIGALLGTDGNSPADDDQTVGAAGLLSASTSIMLPQQHGAVEVQFKGKGKFQPRFLSVEKGELQMRDGDGAQGKLVRTGSVLGCVVDYPRKPRKGHEQAVRVDLAKKDSKKENKYVISVGDAGLLKLWMDCFGAYSSMTPDDLEAMEKEAAESAERELLRASAAVDSSDEEPEDEEEEDSSDEEQPMAPPPLPPLRLSLHIPRSPASGPSDHLGGIAVFIVRSPLAPVERSLLTHATTLDELKEFLNMELELEEQAIDLEQVCPNALFLLFSLFSCSFSAVFTVFTVFVLFFYCFLLFLCAKNDEFVSGTSI